MELSETFNNINPIVDYGFSTDEKTENYLFKNLILTRRSVLGFQKLIEKKKYQEALFLINFTEIPTEKNIKDLLRFISQIRFKSSPNDDVDIDLKIQKDEIKEEDLKEYKKKKKGFCHFADFDLVYSLFLEKYNIDLIDEDLNWFRYLFLLENLFLEENSLKKRLEYRGFIPKNQKGYGKFNEENKKMQEKYSI